ncbi:RDD family protein [Chitinophagaceae bacterium MMS25-I14]
MSSIVVTTPFNIDLEFRVATFAKRVSATLIDILVISAYSFVLWKFIISPLGLNPESGETTLIILVSVPAFLYHLVCETLLNGQSFGKKALGIKVMDKKGNEPTLSQFLIRWILGFSNYILFVIPYIVYLIIVSGGAFIFALVFIFIFYLPDVMSVALTASSQRLGDLAAGTVVIDQKPETGINDMIYLDIEEEDYTPVFPQVMRLSDRDINGIRNLLAMKNAAREVESYMIDVCQRIKKLLVIETDLTSREFLQQLLRDYNYLTRK